MSTIQTQINLVHLQAGLAVPAVTQRTTMGSQFASNAIEVTTTDETIPLGDVTTPKQVMIKFISGDPVRIGLNYGTDGVNYPFRLSAADEAGLLPLDVEGLVEVSFIDPAPDVAGSLNATYFTLEDANGGVRVLLSSDGTYTVPAVDRYVVVTIPEDSTNFEVRDAIMAAFADDIGFTAELITAPGEAFFSLIDRNVGPRAEIAAGTSGFDVSRNQAGAPSPTIHLKSLGTSQIVVAVAPY